MSGDEIVVHPAAAVFPMLSDDELGDLAEDIRVHGLHHPIVLDQKGVLVDGRNRVAACMIAGIEPTCSTLHGHDPVACILSANIRRRHMVAGQRAMALAMMLEIDGRKRTGARALTVESNVSEARISQAVLIRKHASDLTTGIMAGTESFDKAYGVAQARKRAGDEEVTAKDRQARDDALELERVRRVAPDLAALVPDTLTVGDAKVA